MFEAAFSLFDLQGMTLLADREYIGKEWFKFLKENKIHFVIRLRIADYFEEMNAARGNNYEQMQNRCLSKNKAVRKQISLNGHAFTVVMMPNPKPNAEESILIFLTTLHNATQAAASYVRRWKIECLFRHLKTNGYNLEDLNLKDPKKNLLMMAIVTLAYTLTVGEGYQRRQQIPLQRYHDGTQTLEVSIFREGLAFLTEICLCFIDFLRYVFRALDTKNHSICNNVQ